MSTKEIADALVTLGVGSEREGYYSHLGSGFLSELQDAPSWFKRSSQLASSFVYDWQVAGACLQRWPTTINTEHLSCTLDEMLRDPRLIIKAYAKTKLPARLQD